MGRMGPSAAAQFDRIARVYVEGGDDLGVFRDWWFAPSWSDNPTVEFRGPPPTGGGCRWVVSQVEARVGDPNEPPCFGVVDRDALANDPATGQGPALLQIFLDAADRILPAGTPLGDRLYVLSRWEVENYLLLNLDAVFEEARHAPAAMRLASADELGERLLQEAEWLVVLSAGVLHARIVSAPAPPQAFGQGADIGGLRAALTNRYGVQEAVILAVEAQLNAFRADPGASLRERWAAIQRIVDGKRLLQRFTVLLMGRPQQDARVEMAGRLAERHRLRLPDEITGIIGDIRQRALTEIRDRLANEAPTTP